MKMPLRLVTALSLTIFGLFGTDFIVAQSPPNESGDQPVRVNVTMNPDGTRTTYQFDQAHKQATATTTTAAGKVTTKIKYEIDDAGRFSSGVVSGPDGKFLYKSVFKYAGDGRLDEETHLDKGNVLVNRLVYSYDPNGRQSGYVVYDASGNVIGRTTPVESKAAATPKPKKHK
jgi:YD repeat-containing protein